LKIINNLGGYSGSFNNYILQIEFDGKLPNVNIIKADNFIKNKENSENINAAL
ncbi:hypothetical protein QR685DRAFT_446238, partial [Neurospora intermedia]